MNSLKTKNQLAYEIVYDLMRSYSNLFKTSQSTAENAIAEVIKQDDALLDIWTSIRAGFFCDLEKTYPEAFEYPPITLDGEIK